METEAVNPRVDTLEESNRLINRIEKILDDRLKLRLGNGYLAKLTIYDNKELRYGVVFESEDNILFLNRINKESKNGVRIKFKISELQKIELCEKGKIRVTLKDGTNDLFAGEEEPEESIIPEPRIIPKYDGTEQSLWEIMHFLFTEDKLKECIYFDDLEQKLYFDKKLIGSNGLKEYNAADELTSLIMYLQKQLPRRESGGYQKIVRERLDTVIVKLGNENPRNRFLELIEKTEPSTVQCENFLIDIGCNTNLRKGDDNEIYLKAVSTALFLSIIERLLTDGDTPPIKFVPVLIGETNKGKSTICSRLGLSHWYKQTTVSIDDEKRYHESVQGCVIAEMSEGVHMKAQNEETLKAFFDKVEYQYRKSYARESKTIIKRYLEIITTNNNEILTDVTGNVRYYPIRYDLLEEPIIPIHEYTNEEILQYYADALDLYRHEKRWQDYVNKPEIQELAEKMRMSATREIDGIQELQDFVKRVAPDIGDFVSYEDLRDELSRVLSSEKKIDYAHKMFRKACDKYGFERDPMPHKDVSGKSVKGLVRVKLT